MPATSSAQQTIQDFADRLRKGWSDLDAESLADIFWLAHQLPKPDRSVVATPEPLPQPKTVVTTTSSGSTPSGGAPDRVSVVSSPPSMTVGKETLPAGTLPIQITVGQALRSQLALSRALRPLMQKIPSPIQRELDEEATALHHAELQCWSPVLKPTPERWFDLALVVEDSPSLHIWEETITELYGLVMQLGAFRQTRTWRLQSDSSGEIQICSNWKNPSSPKSWKSLKDPTQRRLIWLITDCTSALWQESDRRQSLLKVLREWGKYSSLLLLQPFPERLWKRTSLYQGNLFRVQGTTAGASLSELSKGAKDWFADPDDPDDVAVKEEHQQAIVLPVVSLEPEPMRRWAKVATGSVQSSITGFRFLLPELAQPSPAPLEEEQAVSPPEVSTPEQRIRHFIGSASGTAQQLAGLLVALPVSLPVIYLVQRTLLPNSQQVHVAEVLMGGLLKTIPNSNNAYTFHEGVREHLLEAVPISKTVNVLDTISADVSERLGLGAKTFTALLADPRFQTKQPQVEWLLSFAEIGLNTLKRLGGVYRMQAEALERITPPPPGNTWPPLPREFSVEIATVQVEEIVQFEFETAKIEKNPKSNKWVITKTTGTVWGYIETLTPHPQAEQERDSLIEIPMIEIKGETFRMGSPKGEPESNSDECPQHEVRLGDFWIGQTPITQAQWRVVANYPPVNPDVEFTANPSRFEGDNNPVEQVDWYEAKEFCDRLSAATGKVYDLPTEAEWEYACRAGTTTPFSFGEMITTELANYDGNYPYNNGPKGEYRKQTTPVGTFPANPWGLYDMHGNVWEWCLDHWHDSYNKPEELKQQGNTPWLSSVESSSRLLRGGSWFYNAKACRSAYRVHSAPDNPNYSFGFRVVCRASRTL